MKVGTRLALAIWAICAVGVRAEAQFVPASRARYGLLDLGTGFLPDPQLMNGAMGGPIPAQQINPACRGSITPEPSHIVRTATGFRQIRFVVNGQGDATLLVMLPNGQVLCDDDAGGNANPLIATPSPPGDIRIWVGAYDARDDGRPYTIGVTELATVDSSNLTAPPANVRLDPQATPTFGTVNLRTGFMPDPQIVRGQASGRLRAATIDPNCSGYITPEPSHLIMSQNGFRNFRIAVNSGGLDTTLVVMLPDGRLLCDDDGGSGQNPLLAFTSPPGPIRVWVGVYAQQGSGAYNIGFSELSHIGTESIPSPSTSLPFATPPLPTPLPPPLPPLSVVEMELGIPVTLLGPGLEGRIAARWHPNGAPPTQVTLDGRTLTVGSVAIDTLPESMPDPVVTVRVDRGSLILRAEQAPMARGERGVTMSWRIRWRGAPVVQDRWSGRFGQRGPRWAR